MTRLALIKQLVKTSGGLSAGRETRRSNIACSKGSSDNPIFANEYEEYEDWQYKMRLFLNTECSLCTLQSVDREIDQEDVQDYAMSSDFP